MKPPVGHKSAEGQRVYQTIHERIGQGDYPPGVWLPAERQLAREFGVDRAVIRVALLRLEEQGLIVREPGRRPWVNQKAHPAHLADQPATKRADLRTIAAILPQHPTYHASSAILYGINLELRQEEAPLQLLVYDTHDDSAAVAVNLEKKALQAVEEEQVAGVIIWHMSGDETLPQLRRLQEKSVPIIFVDRYPTEMPCDFVGVDNETSAIEAVQYLLELGHRRIAHLTSTEQTTAVLQRKQGYQEALRLAGILPRPEWIYTVEEGVSPNVRPAVDHFLGQKEPPTAVFAMNDALAHYFIVEAEARGFAVPGAISVMGFDDLERYSPRPALLTTLHQPFDLVGRRAARLLLRRLATPASLSSPHMHILLPTPLAVRSTCGPFGREG